MRTISVLALVAWAVGVPGALRAADLTFALDGSSEYDSNVFRSHGDEKQDVLFRIRPWVQLHEDRGQDFDYSLTYAVPAEFAVDHSEVDDVDQHFSADGTYHVNDRLELFAADTLLYARSELRTNLQGTEGANGQPFINEQRDRTTLNTASIGSRYLFTPRLSGSAQVAHDFFDPTRNDRQQYWQIQGSASLGYTLTPKVRLGGGMMVAHQEFDNSVDIVGSTAEYYNPYLSGQYSIDEKTEFSASVGPAWIFNRQDHADQTQTRGLVPFSDAGDDFTAPNGFVDRFGTDVSGVQYANGAVLVSQIQNCPTLTDNVTRVLISNQSCNLSVVLDKTPGTDDDLITAIKDSTATVTNVNPGGQDDEKLTVFGNATLTRHWTPNLHTALSYVREQGGASGLGGTVVGDSVMLSNTWQITEKWQLAGRGEWGLRKSVGDPGQVNTLATTVLPPLGGAPFTVPIAGLAQTDGGNGAQFVQRGKSTQIDSMRWGAATRLTRFFTRNTTGYLEFTYNQQESQGDSLGAPSDFHDYLVTLGVQHVFEPIKLW